MSDEQPRAIVLGSRASVLAKIQTNLVLDALRSHFSSRTFEASFMTTQGDKNKRDPVYLLGGKALFTQELETALLKGDADLLVHSLKDVPTTLPDGCEVRPILEREDPADALVVKAGLEYKSLDEVPEGSVIGTGSFRRVAQLKRLYPKLVFKDLRGNIDTRLAKLDAADGPFTAIILAKAGLVRYGAGHRVTAVLRMHHAVGQAALGLEIREGDARARELCAALVHWPTEWTCLAERACLRVLEGGCSVPVGVKSALLVDGEERVGMLELTGSVTSLDGSKQAVHTITEKVASGEEAENVGVKLAKILLETGARAILDEIRRFKERAV